jgi:hypothetical protein
MRMSSIHNIHILGIKAGILATACQEIHPFSCVMIGAPYIAD